MNIINIYGGPGVGKSTGAAMIFAKMKMLGINCELVTEYAKTLTYEKRFEILQENQLYVLQSSIDKWKDWIFTKNIPTNCWRRAKLIIATARRKNWKQKEKR